MPAASDPAAKTAACKTAACQPFRNGNLHQDRALYCGTVLEMNMSLGTIVLIILILLLLGALPTWPYSAGWGYYPSGGLGLVVIILLVLVLVGRI